MGYLVGIDLGTSSCKTVLFNEQFETICTSSIEYQVCITQKYCAEQPSDYWWNALIKTVREVLELSKINSKDIDVIEIVQHWSEFHDMSDADRLGSASSELVHIASKNKIVLTNAQALLIVELAYNAYKNATTQHKNS